MIGFCCSLKRCPAFFCFFLIGLCYNLSTTFASFKDTFLSFWLLSVYFYLIYLDFSIRWKTFSPKNSKVQNKGRNNVSGQSPNLPNELPVCILNWNFLFDGDEEAEIPMGHPSFLFLCFSFLFLFNRVYINLFPLGSAYCQLKHMFLHSDGSVWLQ